MDNSLARVRDGTAQRQRGKDRVKKILQSAKVLFLRQGYTGLSLRRVAKLAGISLGNLTYYFSSKADLFESMIDQIVREYSGRWDQIWKAHADNPAAQIDAYLQFLFADCRRPETQQFFYQFWAVASHDQFVAKARERAYAEFRAQMKGYCKLINPDLDDAASSERVFLLMALVEGMCVIFGNEGEPIADPDRLQREFKRQALNIIRS